MIPLDDRGLLLGDGLFETLLAVDGVLAAPGPHLDRMAAGCASLGLPPLDRAAAGRAMAEALAGLDAPRAAVRLTLTAGSQHLYERDREGISRVLCGPQVPQNYVPFNPRGQFKNVEDLIATLWYAAETIGLLELAQNGWSVK